MVLENLSMAGQALCYVSESAITHSCLPAGRGGRGRIRLTWRPGAVSGQQSRNFELQREHHRLHNARAAGSEIPPASLDGLWIVSLPFNLLIGALSEYPRPQPPALTSWECALVLSPLSSGWSRTLAAKIPAGLQSRFRHAKREPRR